MKKTFRFWHNSTVKQHMLWFLKAETLTRYSAWHAVDYTQSSPVSHLLPFYNMFDMDHTCHVSASLAVSFKDGNDVWSVGWLVSQSFQHFPPEQDLFTSSGPLLHKKYAMNRLQLLSTFIPPWGWTHDGKSLMGFLWCSFSTTPQTKETVIFALWGVLNMLAPWSTSEAQYFFFLFTEFTFFKLAMKVNTWTLVLCTFLISKILWLKLLLWGSNWVTFWKEFII